MLIPRPLRTGGLVAIVAASIMVPLGANSLLPAAPPSISAATGQNPLIGLVVFGSDGTRVGTIDSVDGESDGRIAAISVRTGGFLEFGTKVVSVAEGKFELSGNSVRVALTAEELSKLPVINE